MRPRDTGASRRLTRWIPAIAAPIAIGAAVVLVPMQANAAVDLPDLTPEELLEFAASSDVEALSGTIEQRSELGLPDLSGLTGAMGGAGGDIGSARDSARAPMGTGHPRRRPTFEDLLSLATGTHTARVYLDGANARLQVLDELAERNVYLSEDGAWVYDSAEKAATHVTVDRAALDALKAEARGRTPTSGSRTARGRARRAAADARGGARRRRSRSSTRPPRSRVGTDTRVAGREVYELVLEPRDDDTLVGEVSVAIDGENGVPLAASVTARGADEPAFSVAFTEVSFQAPDASVFAFSPPEGTTVTEHEVPVPTPAELEQWKAEAEAGAGGAAAMRSRGRRCIGEGWSAVVELRGGRMPRAAGRLGDRMPPGGGLGEASAMLDTLTAAASTADAS